MGIVPPHPREGMEYFMTLPLNTEGSAEFSIFVASIDERLAAGSSSQVNGSGLVQVVVHPRSQRGEPNSWTSSLSEHPILLEPPQEDWMYDRDSGERYIYAGSKLGGRPEIYRSLPEEDLPRLDAEGFLHLLQVEIDAEPDTVTGEWPFGDAVFNLFFRPSFGWDDWRWIWQL